MIPERVPRKIREVFVSVDSEWKTAGPGTKLITDGLGPCVGIALFDFRSIKAALGHLATPSDNKAVIQRRVCRFVGQGTGVTLFAYVRGGGPTGVTIEEIARMHEDRNTVLEILYETGVNDDRINVEWLTDTTQIAGMEINCGTGVFRSFMHYK